MKAISAILFDLGNVLIDLDIPRTEQRFRALLGDAFEASFARNEQHGVFRQFELGEIGEADFLLALKQNLQEEADDELLRQAWNALLLGIPAHRFRMLDALKSNFRLFVLSNTNATHIEWVRQYLLREHGIQNFEERFFEKVYYSHEVHLRKPDREVYEYVLNDSGLRAEELLFIDDNAANVAAAAELGIHSVLHNDGRDVSALLLEMGLLKKDFAETLD